MEQDELLREQPEKAFGTSSTFIASLSENSLVAVKGLTREELLQEAQNLATCRYESNTLWGSEARADLSDADLRGADFSLASVTKANLTNANLEGALATGNTSFKGSIITGADFTDVPLRDDQLEYLCKVAEGVNPTTGNATRETLFCK